MTTAEFTLRISFDGTARGLRPPIPTPSSASSAQRPAPGLDLRAPGVRQPAAASHSHDMSTTTPASAPAISLVNDGDQWRGTFALTVRFLTTDLLTDDAPFNAVVQHDTDGPTEEVRGEVTDSNESALVIGGKLVAFTDIVRIDVL